MDTHIDGSILAVLAAYQNNLVTSKMMTLGVVQWFPTNLPLIQQYFCAVYDYVEKADLGKGYQNPKRKLGVTRHFSEIIELKFGEKLPYTLCILTLF